MPEQRQTMTEVPYIQEAQFSIRSEHLSSLFVGGPTSDDTQTELFQQKCMHETIVNGYGLASFNPNFKNAPNLLDVKLSKDNGGGYPSTPYVPNLSSPGEGNGIDANSQASIDTSTLPSYLSYVDAAGNLTSQNEFGSGLQGDASPNTTSEKIGSFIINDYGGEYGRSYPDSEGGYSEIS